MTRDLLPFPAAPPRSMPTPRIDLSWSTRALLRKLNARLPLAIQFRDLVLSRDRHRGEPALFFFDDKQPARKMNFADTPAAMAVARSHPELAAAWADLSDLTDDAFTLLAANVELRHLARTASSLQSNLALLGGHHAKCRALAELLQVSDDEVLRVIFPRQRAGFRVNVSGIVDVAQFHLLLADVIHGDPRRGYLAGARPDPRLVHAYRFEAVDHERDAATACFQFYHPAALTSDGTLPQGFSGNDHWLWGHERLSVLPVTNRERLLLADTAVYPRQWIVGRKFAAVEGVLDLLEVMTAEQVTEQLSLPKLAETMAA